MVSLGKGAVEDGDRETLRPCGKSTKAPAWGASHTSIKKAMSATSRLQTPMAQQMPRCDRYLRGSQQPAAQHGRMEVRGSRVGLPRKSNATKKRESQAPHKAVARVGMSAAHVKCEATSTSIWR